MVWVTSKNLTPNEQAYASMQNSIREFFFHGKEKYDYMRGIYSVVYHEVYKSDIFFPDYEDILESFHSYGTPNEAQGPLEYIASQEGTTLFFYCVVGISFVTTIHLMIISYFDTPVVERNMEQTLAAQGSKLRKLRPNKYATRNMIRLYLRDHVLEEGISLMVLDYVGKCLVSECRFVRYKTSVCPQHTYKFNLLLIEHQKYMHLRNCYGCAAVFFRGTSSMTMFLCPQCFALYVCWLCEPGVPCRHHVGIDRVSTMTAYLERSIVADTREEDRVYDSSKNLFFFNYHRALGARI
jgi:hypothetical protein